MRIGIFQAGGSEWTGGEHYVRNLVTAIGERGIAQVVLFVPANCSLAQSLEWSGLKCDVVPLKRLVRWTPSWWLQKLVKQSGNRRLDFQIESLLQKYKIDVTYMDPRLVKKNYSIPSISWIPDFQHLHLPKMFSHDEIRERSMHFQMNAENSSIVVLSSQEAHSEFSRLFPEFAWKARVLHFVVPVMMENYRQNSKEVAARYKLPEKFFYFPAQFWKHKNHGLVAKALAIAKKSGHDITVVCSGNPKDYRDPEYMKTLRKVIWYYGVESNLILLGMIPFKDVLPLMRESIAVLNPSLFEGWSTTVEEAKSLGKHVLLSDIPVHFEQDPPGGTFFERRNPEDLAIKLIDRWRDGSPGPDTQLEALAQEAMARRLRQFASRFFEIVQEAIHLDRTISAPSLPCN